jgi:putative addiction module killer protein
MARNCGLQNQRDSTSPLTCSTVYLNIQYVRAVARIRIRIDRLLLGNTGDVKAVGEGISELRIEYGSGSQVCFKKTGKKLVLLRCGGNKLSQTADIKTANRMAKDL